MEISNYDHQLSGQYREEGITNLMGVTSSIILSYKTYIWDTFHKIQNTLQYKALASILVKQNKSLMLGACAESESGRPTGVGSNGQNTCWGPGLPFAILLFCW